MQALQPPKPLQDMSTEELLDLADAIEADFWRIARRSPSR